MPVVALSLRPVAGYSPTGVVVNSPLGNRIGNVRHRCSAIRHAKPGRPVVEMFRGRVGVSCRSDKTGNAMRQGDVVIVQKNERTATGSDKRPSGRAAHRLLRCTRLTLSVRRRDAVRLALKEPARPTGAAFGGLSASAASWAAQRAAPLSSLAQFLLAN